MFKVIHNIETNEMTEVPLTQEEIDVILVNRAEAEKFQAELDKKIKVTNDAKAALLTKLGITADEAKLLLG